MQYNQVLDADTLKNTDNAIPISARLVHALEKPSGDISIIGPVTNTPITANMNAKAERPINDIISFCIVPLLFFQVIKKG